MAFGMTKTLTPILTGLTLLLAGCGGGGPSGTPPVRQVAVTTDQINLTGPEGFCVDTASTRDDGATAFVLLGNCAVISNQRSAGQPRNLAVLTASVSEADPAQSLRDSIPELNAFFQSTEGRQLLSRTGNADSVEILDSFHQGDVYFLHARDTSASEIQDVSPEYWRSYLDLRNRIATLTVLGLEENPISDEASLSLLRQFTDLALIANPVGTTPGAQPAALPTAPVAPPPVQQPTAQTQGGLFNVGLFRRIMGR